MTIKTTTTVIEILGKPYPIRCQESELKCLQQAAELLNQKMTEVKESGKAINLERIAIITALNIAYQFLQLDEQKNCHLNRINQQINLLYTKLDVALTRTIQQELACE